MTTTDLANRLGEVDARQKASLETTPKTASVLDLIKGRRSLYAGVLNNTIDPERFVRVALATVGRTPGLLACKQESLLGALMLSAQLGLEPGTPLGHAYLVPFGQECTFIVGYKGYVELARRAGQMVYAEAVFEGDEFSWELGLSRDIKHRPVAEDRTDYAKLTHVYAVARSLTEKDAPPSFVVMTKAQVEVVRKRARSQSGPWKTDPIEMAIKTPVRRLSKWMPMSVEMAQAAAVDERGVTRIDADLDGFVDDLDVIDVPAQSELPPPAGDASAGSPSGDGSNPAGPAEGPTDDGSLQKQAAALVHELADEALDGWTAYKKKQRISNDPTKWSDEQAEGVIKFVHTPLHTTGEENDG